MQRARTPSAALPLQAAHFHSLLLLQAFVYAIYIVKKSFTP